MEPLISNQSSIIQSVPESYVLKPEIRPGRELVVPACQTIPVIDLQQGLVGDHKELIQQIMKASQEYGFFQLTNHGVSEELMQNVLKVGREFFELSAEDKKNSFNYSEDPNQTCRLKTSVDYGQEKVHFWRDNLRHSSHPVEDHIKHWPTNPPHYREVFGRYSVELRKLGLLLLELIFRGLGLELGHFGEGLIHGQFMSTNHYPPCPDPTLVLGLPKHADPYVITILNQGNSSGLQVLKDDQWLAVEPLPNGFVVNINHMLQIISNGKLKSAYHRVVTNTSMARTTVASFIHPSYDYSIEPAKTLVNEYDNPPLYKSVIFKDFMTTYIADTAAGKESLERYMV